MFSAKKVVLGVTAAGLLAAPLAACSSSGSNTGSNGGNSSSASAAATTPVAQVANVSGKTTAVKLDAGFLKALTSLKLTPGVVGTAKLTDGSLVFPITGGSVKYFTPGTVDPYVQGELNHQGSGLSLTAGGTKVELTNFTINPGTSKLMGDVSANGKSVAKQAYLFALDGSTLQPLRTGAGTAILTGTTVYISTRRRRCWTRRSRPPPSPTSSRSASPPSPSPPSRHPQR